MMAEMCESSSVLPSAPAPRFMAGACEASSTLLVSHQEHLCRTSITSATSSKIEPRTLTISCEIEALAHDQSVEPSDCVCHTTLSKLIFSRSDLAVGGQPRGSDRSWQRDFRSHLLQHSREHTSFRQERHPLPLFPLLTFFLCFFSLCFPCSLLSIFSLPSLLSRLFVSSSLRLLLFFSLFSFLFSPLSSLLSPFSFLLSLLSFFSCRFPLLSLFSLCFFFFFLSFLSSVPLLAPSWPCSRLKCCVISFCLLCACKPNAIV